MVGLVIVSHSAKLAAGVAELARGMAGPDVRIAATGGLDLPDQPLGTDANLVLQAIEQVYSDDGVLVLMDLGSAILSTEMALEQLPPARRQKIALTEAPLVEGAVAAAVQARLGSKLEQVLNEARGALVAKTIHLQATPPPPTLSPGEPAARSHELRLSVRNRLGLHARPAARFVQTAARFNADIRVHNLTTARGPVSAKSINAVATLGALQGHEIQITASGPDAVVALTALRALAAADFGDADGAKPKPEQPQPGGVADAGASVGYYPAGQPIPRGSPTSRGSPTFVGLAASPGIAIGPARLHRPYLPPIPQNTIDDPAREWEMLLAALDKTRAQLQATREAVKLRGDDSAAAIFDAHLLFLQDDALREPARHAIFEEHLNAAAAWQRATHLVAAQYDTLDDPYLRARGGDVTAVGHQVLLNLLGADTAAPLLQAQGILVASDPTPAETARLDPTLVLGICTAFGGPMGHSAILARGLGLPAVVGLGERILALADGTSLIVDGDNGAVWANPPAELTAEYTRRLEAKRAAGAQARATSAGPAITRDGRRIEVVANIGSVADARLAAEAGAEGVGLFRTEFLFLNRRTAPSEDEQCEAYRAAAAALGSRPLIIRTLDVGGDKPLPYVNVPLEANPFLGWRGIRLCLAQPEFFKTQLRAIARVAAEFPVKVMFPMIATLEEWRAARGLLAEAKADLARRGVAVPEQLETGIMVEVPAAALRAAQFAAEVDFFSIGTNDLTQYTLAAERGNPRVAALADAFHPAVLQLIALVVQAAHPTGISDAQHKWVGVCGEFAGDPQAIPLLVGLGIDELSMNAPAIARAKQIVRALDYAAARVVAERAVGLETPAAVRNYLQAEVRIT